MVTSASLYHLLSFFNITIDIRNVCVFLAPFFSSLTTIVTYLLTKELKVSCKIVVLIIALFKSVLNNTKITWKKFDFSINSELNDKQQTSTGLLKN